MAALPTGNGVLHVGLLLCAAHSLFLVCLGRQAEREEDAYIG